VPTGRRLCVAACLLLLAGSAAMGHGVRCFATARDGRVHGRAWFIGGGKPANCPVKVYLPDGALFLETRTDTAGEFRFETADRSPLKIVVEAGEGHRAEYMLKGATPTTDAPEPGRDDRRDTAVAMPADSAASDDARLKAIVREAVRDEVAVLRMDLEQSRRAGPGATEIIGGIGWILGLMGVVLWARSRAGGNRSAGPS